MTSQRDIFLRLNARVISQSRSCGRDGVGQKTAANPPELGPSESPWAQRKS